MNWVLLVEPEGTSMQSTDEELGTFFFYFGNMISILFGHILCVDFALRGKWNESDKSLSTSVAFSYLPRRLFIFVTLGSDGGDE